METKPTPRNVFIFRPLLSAALLLAAQHMASGVLCAEIQYKYNTDGNTVILDNYPALTEDFVSGGTNGVAAVHNRIILQGEGNLFVGVRGDLMNPLDPYASGFESMEINGPEWLIASNVNLTGTSATTFHVVSGSHTIGGPITGQGIITAPKGDGPKATIDAGATLTIGTMGGPGRLFVGGIVNNGTLIFAQNNAVFSDPILGTGAVFLTRTASVNTLTLTGSSSYSGGTYITIGSVIAKNAYAFGTGVVDFQTAYCSLMVNLDKPADVVFKNELKGNGRLYVNLGSGTNVFKFGDALGSQYGGSLYLQQGILDLRDNTAASTLANSNLHLSAASSTAAVKVLIGSGTKHINNLVMADTAAADKINGGTLVFDIDIAAPASPVGNSQLSGNNLTMQATGIYAVSSTIQLGTTMTSPLSKPALPAFTLFGQDDDNIIVKLIAASGLVDVNAANIKLVDANNAVITNATSYGVVQGTSGTVANATYDYRLTTGSKNDGLYVNYGLTNLNILSGKTLDLRNSGTGTAATNTLSARLTGAGNVEINATNTLWLNGVGSTYTGSTVINSGKVILGENKGLGTTSALRIKSGAQLDMNGRQLTVGPTVLENGSSLILNGGNINITHASTSGDTTIAPNSLSGSGEFRITIPATGTGNVIFEGDNPNFSARFAVVNSSAKSEIVIKTADALGAATIAIGTGSIVYRNVSGTSRVSSENNNGLVVIASSTLFMTGTTRLNTRLVNSDVTFGPSAQLGGTGIITVDKDSTMRIGITGLSQSTATNPLVFEGGTLDFVTPTKDIAPRLTINDLRGSGTIWTNVNPNTGASNVLVFKKSTGAFDLNVRCVEKAEYGDQVMPLYLLSGTDAKATINLVNGQVESGAYVFKLIQGTGGNTLMPDKDMWYLAADRGAVSRAAKAILATAAIIGAEWHYSLDSVSKRMGDLRQEFGSGGKAAKGGKPLKGNIWTRVSNQNISAKESLCGAEFTEEVWVINAGMDTSFRSSSATTFVGVFGGAGRTDRIFKYLGDGGTDSISVGMYVTWLADNGWFADLVGKDDMVRNKFHAIASDGRRINATYDGDVWGASLEIGKQIYMDKARHWWIAPGAQVAYATLKSDDYTTDNEIDVQINTGNSQQYRAQLRFGYNDKNARFLPYAKLAGVYTTSSGGEIAADQRELQADFDGLRIEAGFGGSYLIDRRNQVYAEYEYASADTYKRSWSMNVGYRHAW